MPGLGNNTNDLRLQTARRRPWHQVDIGALTNSKRPLSVISYAWLQQYGLPADGSADFIDSDGDGMNNWQEWIAGTDPTDASSVLKMLSVANSDVTGFRFVTWQSVNGVVYFMHKAAPTSVASHPSSRPSKAILSVRPAPRVTWTPMQLGPGPFFLSRRRPANP